MREAHLALAGAPREPDDERVWLSRNERVERRFHLCGVDELREPRCPRVKLPHRLRTAKHEYAQYRELPRVEVQCVGQQMLVFRHARSRRLNGTHETRRAASK